MFEFFLALFGVGYYAHKGFEYNREKKERKANLDSISDKVHNRTKSLQEWENIVTDRELEELVEYKVYDREQYDAVMSEVRSVYSELSEGSYLVKENLALHTDMVPIIYGKHTKKESEKIVRSDRLFAMRILMANKGKLLTSDTRGIPQTLWSDDIPAIMKRQWHMNEVEFIRWIDTRLKEHRIDYKLYTYRYLTHEAHILTDEWAKQLWNCIGITYIWEPYITFGIDKVID